MAYTYLNISEILRLGLTVARTRRRKPARLSTGTPDEDAHLPTRAALLQLKAPFQEAEREDAHAADQLTLFCPAHALDLLGDVLDVRPRKASGAQQVGLFAALAACRT